MTRVTVGRTARTVVAGLIAATTVSAAQAYLRTAGSGAGTATTGTAVAIELLPAAVTDALYPGDTSTVAVTAHNPGSTEVRIRTLALDTARGTNGFARASGSTSCGLTTFTFTAQTNGGEGWTLPGHSSLDINLPEAITASTSTASACQDATLTVYLKAS